MRTQHGTPMSLRKIDLNLFRIFEAVMAQRSITAASRELHVTPSAVSHALGRLRSVLADPLFIPSESGMEPTPRALQLAPHIRAGLERIDGALQSRQFDPQHTSRVFRIAASDYGSVTVLPKLVARLAQTAPKVDLRVFPFNRLDTVRQLDDGRIDIALSWFNELPARMCRHPIWQDEEAVIVRKGHPLAEGKLTKERLLAFPHIVVELTGSSDIPVAGYLDDRGVSRRVWIERLLLDLRADGETLVGRAAVSVPHFATVVPTVIASDMVATLPLSLAAAPAARGDVVLLTLPYEPLRVKADVIWHERSNSDPALQWLIAETIAAMPPVL